MIVKIADQYMTGSYLSPDEKPDGFEFFPAYKASGVTYCFITDGMSNYIAVPFDVITLPSQEINDADRMVSLDILDSHSLPHGKP